MKELGRMKSLKIPVLALQDCDKTMSKDGKDGKDDVGSLAQMNHFGAPILI